jgi:XTP/dITP diphosphohydrolase
VQLLIATNNAGKVREYQEILQELLPEVELLILSEAGIAYEVDETGETFEENARLKATEYAARSGMTVIADDSGLEVAALGGFPGVKSARWTGPTAEDRNRELLKLLADTPPEARAARFVCVTVCCAPDGREVVGYGEVAGRIGFEPRGTNGFGYDPLFLLPERGVTMAELPSHEKHAISHRGRAARTIAPHLRLLMNQI